jgi:hypothetical protein
MTGAQGEGASVNTKSNEATMKNVVRYRAMASLCRQHAAYNPNDGWKLLAQAEHLEHLAAVEMSSRFEECNTVGSADVLEPASSADNTGWHTTAAA